MVAASRVDGMTRSSQSTSSLGRARSARRAEVPLFLPKTGRAANRRPDAARPVGDPLTVACRSNTTFRPVSTPGANPQKPVGQRVYSFGQRLARGRESCPAPPGLRDPAHALAGMSRSSPVHDVVVPAGAHKVASLVDLRASERALRDRTVQHDEPGRADMPVHLGCERDVSDRDRSRSPSARRRCRWPGSS